MTNINQVIANLVQKGQYYQEKYPKRIFRLFHHQQNAAGKLLALKTKAEDLSSDSEKVQLVQSTVYELYHNDFTNSLSSLLQDIHQVLMTGKDFAAYKEKYLHIQAGYPEALLSLEDFRTAIEEIKPTTAPSPIPFSDENL